MNDNGRPRDLAADTIEGRLAVLEKIVRESRTPQPKGLEGFSYSLKLKNEYKTRSCILGVSVY